MFIALRDGGVLLVKVLNFELTLRNVFLRYAFWILFLEYGIMPEGSSVSFLTLHILVAADS